MSRIRVEKFYMSPPEQVWQTLTDSHALGAWLMNTDFKPVRGHRFHFRAKPQLGRCGVIGGVVKRVVPGLRLVYEWQGEPGGKPTTVRWTLTPEADGTRVLLEHYGFEGVRGWFQCMMMAAGWRKLMRSGFEAVLNAYATGQTHTLKPRFA